MQHEFKLNGKNYIAVSTPEYEKYEVSYLQGDSDVIGITNGNLHFINSLPEYCCERVKDGIINKVEIIGLYPRNFTEEIAKNLVEQYKREDLNIASYRECPYYNYVDSKSYFAGDTGWFKNSALESFASKMEVEELYLTNPYLHLGSEKPKGDVLISYNKGETFDDSVEWTDKRTCMMAGIAGGHGYFQEGWATSHSSQTDTGLICDPPDFWIHADDEEDYLKAKLRTSSQWLIIKVKE